MAYPSRLFLIGPRGSGKSTVARALAEQLDYDCVDSDDLIEHVAGKSIDTIFAEDGEPVFRDVETKVIATLSQNERTVIALGGGSVMREVNRSYIIGSGPVIWLTAELDTLMDRIQSDATSGHRRPSLTQLNELEEMKSVMALRRPIYSQCATIQVDTEGKSPAEIVAEIGARLLADD